MNLKMSIKSIVLFEKMTNVPFSDISFSEDSILNNPEIFLKLLYCILLSHEENNVNCTFEDACKNIFNDQNLVLFSSMITNEMNVLNQFIYNQQVKKIDSASLKENKTQEKKSVYMKDLVPILILDCGLSPDYVLNELSYTDIDMYFKYREDKHKNDLEEKRLFTFLTVLPHIDGKKIKTPQKFYTFPWEKEDAKKQFKKDYKKIRQKMIDAGIIQPKEGV